MERALDLTRKAAGLLHERGFANARLEAELLLAGLLGLKRLELYLQHDRPVDAAELEKFRAMVRRRLRHEPIQYILGTAAFRDLELNVDARVLIPRPETELLVGAVLDWCAQHDRWGHVLDIGTGSGAIAVSLAHEGRFERVVACDISRDALKVAYQNAQRCDVASRVTFVHGPLFDAVPGDVTFDVIVSNPPYVGESERASLAPEVRDHEPAIALFAGSDGMTVIDKIIAEAPSRLTRGGLLAIEIGITQGDAVLACVEQSGAYGTSRIAPDLTGRPRMLLAERA